MLLEFAIGIPLVISIKKYTLYNMHSVTSNAVAESFFKELWTNPNTSDDFYPQDIVVPNRENYRFIVVGLLWANYWKMTLNTVYINSRETVGQLSVTSYDLTHSQVFNCARDITISGDTIHINDGILFLNNVYQGVRNDICIPYKIYGVK